MRKENRAVKRLAVKDIYRAASALRKQYKPSCTVAEWLSSGQTRIEGLCTDTPDRKRPTARKAHSGSSADDRNR